MKRQLNLALLIVLLALGASCSVFKPAPRPLEKASAATAALLERMPTEATADAGKNAAELLRLGPGQIEAVCAMVNPGAVDDSKAQFALGAVTTYACRPGAEADRELMGKVYVNALRRAATTEAKAFMIRQLELIGRDVAVAPLRDCLGDERLRAPAVRALVVIYSPEAQRALVRGLAAAKTDAARIDLVQALGDLRLRDAAGRILKLANAVSPALRLEAWWALANIGDPRAESFLKHCAFNAASTDPAKYASFYLLYLRRQAEANNEAKCAEGCREILKAKSLYAADSVHYRCAALATLVEVLGSQPNTPDNPAMPDLLAAADGDPELRAAALKLAVKLNGPLVTGQWLEKLAKTEAPAERAAIVTMLGLRGDREASKAVLAALKDGDAAVRLAAIDAAVKLRTPRTTMSQTLDDETGFALANSLAGAAEPEEQAALKGALLRIPGNEYQNTLATAFKQAAPAGRVAILELLAARQAHMFSDVAFAGASDADAAVRVAALKSLRDLATEKDLSRMVALLLDAKSGAEQTAARNALAAVLERAKDRDGATAQILTAYGQAPAARKPALLALLPGAPTASALKAIRQESQNGQAAIRDAAIRALADWPEPAPMAELLALSKSGGTPALRAIAYRGYVRMIGQQQGLSAAQKVELCQKAMAAAPSREEAKPLIATLGTIATPEAFRAVAACLDDAALREEAALAAATIAGNMKAPLPAEVQTALKKIQTAKVSNATRAKARKALGGARR